MPNFNRVFRDEVARLARKEVRSNTDVARRAATQHRKDIAQLKRTITDLERRLAFIEGREKKRLATPPPEAAAEGTRFSPKWVKADRKRLGISAKDYAALVGVSPLTIYNWEHGKTKPRAPQQAAWVAIRGLGKREALRRLEMLEE